MMPIIPPADFKTYEDEKLECPHCHHRFLPEGGDCSFWVVMVSLLVIGIVIGLAVWFKGFVADLTQRTFSVYLSDSFASVFTFFQRLVH